MIYDVNYWLFGDLTENIPPDYCDADPGAMIAALIGALAALVLVAFAALKSEAASPGDLLARLAEWSLGCGSATLFLQVLADNAPARALYGKCGFRLRYQYHYRVRPR